MPKLPNVIHYHPSDDTKLPKTRLEIYEGAIKHNLQAFRQAMGDQVRLAPGVKGNGFGTDAVSVAQILQENGSEFTFVNSVPEALELREAGLTIPILITGYVAEHEESDLVQLDSTHQIISSLDMLKRLNTAAKAAYKNVKAHIMIDTGINREGFKVTNNDELQQLVTHLKDHSSNLDLVGVCTHFATADGVTEKEIAIYNQQLKNFKNIHAQLKEHDFNFEYTHSANSAATLRDIGAGQEFFNLARPGISLFGPYPDDQVQAEIEARGITLKQATSFKTEVIEIKEVAASEIVGYAGTFTAEQPVKVALLPVGYYEGIKRRESNNGFVLINGKRRKILGRVSMHYTAVEADDDTKLHDEVVIWGQQGAEFIDLKEIYNRVGTNPHNIMLAVNNTVQRVLIHN